MSLTAALRARSHGVVEYRRTLPREKGTGDVRLLDLRHPFEPGLFSGVSCLVHAAWDLRESDPSRAWSVNVEGSRRLLGAATQAGVRRIVFLSSMSAYFGTRQGYGLMKLAVERTVLEAGQVVVRPGLVYGPSAGGMMGTLRKLARLPVIPTFKGANQYMLHVDDFVNAMAKVVETEEVPSTVVGLAHPEPVAFDDLMRCLIPVGRTPRLVQVPWRPVLMALKAGERLGVPLPVRSESLLGLVRPAPAVPGQDVGAALGCVFRSGSAVALA